MSGLLKRYALPGPGVVIGPGIGLDAAVLRLSTGKYLIAKSDPITFVAEDIGRYAVHINSNDIAVMGGRPGWLLATILLPSGTSEKKVKSLFSGLGRACKKAGISLAGGHTEITDAVKRPVVIGLMIGEVDRKKIITAGGAKPGDAVILTKGIAIEAVSIIAREKGALLKKKFPKSFVERCKRFMDNPGISVVKDAETALKSGRVHAMHDPTEGGLSTGLHELSIASGCGVLVDSSLIRVLPETRILARHFQMDPLGLIASGALLICADGRDSEKIIKALKKAGVDAAVIGDITEKRFGVKIKEEGKVRPLKFFKRDELTKALK